MTSAQFAIPGDLSSPTGGYAYDRHILKLLPKHGISVSHLPLPGTYPFPDEHDLALAQTILSGCKPTDAMLIDGLAFGAMPPEVIRAIPGPIIALVHHPLAYETGLSAAQASTLQAVERTALAYAQLVVATGEVTLRLLTETYGVDPNRCRLAVPGTEPRIPATGTGQPVALLTVGAISPRKNYTGLVAALATLGDLDWQLTIAGSTSHDPAETRHLTRAICDANLQDRIRLTGAIPQEELDQAYEQADAFVMASAFEGFGMVLTEALARGLPIVTTKVGAASTVIPDNAAIKVATADCKALADALRIVISDKARRRAMSDAAAHAASTLPRWDDTAGTIARAIKDITL